MPASFKMNDLLRVLFRLFNWLAAFSVCAHNLGTGSALKIFVLNRCFARTYLIKLRFSQTDWKLRGKMDYPVMHQFWSLNYRIIDTPENPIRTIIDAGANIGDSALRFLHFYATATVIAVEPDKINADLLAYNTGHFGKRMIVERCGLSARDGKMTFVCGDSPLGHKLIEAAPDSLGKQVPVVSINTLLKKHRLDRLDILKVDIEGAERDLFGQAEEWLNICNTIVWEVNDHQCPGALQTLLERINRLEAEWNFHIVDEYLIGIRSSTGWKIEKYRFLT